MDNLIENQRRFFNTGITKEYHFRKTQLEKLCAAVTDYEPKIFAALEKDLGKHRFESFLTETSMITHEIKFILKRLKSWMEPWRVHSPLTVMPARSMVYPEPLGVALVISPWNYPFQLAMAPLAAALSAGCCAIVKPSEFSPYTSDVVADLVSTIFPKEYVSVVLGGVEASESLLKQKFDSIFFTGSTTVGKIVMTQAAQHLTPVTLELGGKSPCIVDETADIKSAAKKIMWGKCLNSGQTCVAPDYVLASDNVREELMFEMAAAAKKFYGESPLTNDEYGRIVNTHHFERLIALISSNKVYSGGRFDAATLKIEPTIIDSPELSNPIMQGEIFGPLMPVLKMHSLADAVELINARPKPLALYLFTKSDTARQEIIDKVSFGSGAVNDTVMQLANQYLPFGGVGASGMGQYHGKAGFDTFTHYKSVLEKGSLFDAGIQYPPYKNKLEFVRKLFKFI